MWVPRQPPAPRGQTHRVPHIRQHAYIASSSTYFYAKQVNVSLLYVLCFKINIIPTFCENNTEKNSESEFSHAAYEKQLDGIRLFRVRSKDGE